MRFDHWRDPTKAEVACEALKDYRQRLLPMKIIDAIVPEPEGGAHNDHEESARLLLPRWSKRCRNSRRSLPRN